MKRTFLTAAVALSFGLSGSQLQAQDQNAEFEIEDFVETASAAGQAEINAAQMALEDGSPQLHGFASTLVEDHQTANRKLEEIAEENNLEMSDEAGLMDRAESGMLSTREGDSFDQAFLDEQIEAHEESIDLFQKAAESGNTEISAFAAEMLPTLQEHLRRAEQLRSRIGDRSS